MNIKEAIAKVVGHASLIQTEMEQVMEEIMTGVATPAQVAAFITALRMKGETVAEITGAARVMRKQATRVEVEFESSPNPEIIPNTLPDILVDTCGTGGDGSHTFNISTATALVVAAAGLKVAKHGNRSVSSLCGSADVLQALGVNLDLTAAQVAASIRQIGIGFLFAPLLHGAMRYAIGPRREIGIRTIFNLLGPLTNPAGANVQLLGVYDSALTRTLAAVLAGLGENRAMVVHGAGGLDELSLAGANHIAWLKGGTIEELVLKPADAGLDEAPLSALRGGDAQANAALFRELLAGEKGPRRDIVLLNSAAVFVVAERAADFHQGVELAAATIDSGSARQKLEELIQFSNAL
ncbi:MAG: anthranilate phosphoribosyltransferase [Deltaproteobacteria bacterium]|nr:anthranilate phosphoribosyltransferase [Deltaproteobacteria bacterium]